MHKVDKVFSGLPKATAASAARDPHAADPPQAEFELWDSLPDKESTLKSSNIALAYLSTRPTSPNAGKVLRHCKRQLELFRSGLGGSVCVFKIGYCSNPPQRFKAYELANFTHMMLLHVTSCKGTAQMLEAALIDSHRDILGCRNESPGGEGPRHVQASHFFVYVVGARADKMVPIGG